MLEDGALGDAQRDGDVADAGGVVAVLGEMLRRGLDDAGALRLRPGARRRLPLVQRRSNAVAGDSWHNND